MGEGDIEISNYSVAAQKPKVFVVMQFENKFDELYFEVIKKICLEFGCEPLHIDEKLGSGLIISEIGEPIRESVALTAEISSWRPLARGTV